jgi:hypothetical protein
MPKGKITLQQYGDNLWAVRVPMKMMGMDLGTQMTIVRLPDQSLILISPISIDENLKQEITALGKVTAVISPNTFHHLFARDCLQAFPAAKYLCPAALPKRIVGLPENFDLYSVDEGFWQGQLQTRRISSSHIADEMVFFHPESKTLIVTDLFQYSVGRLGIGTSLFALLAGTYHKPAVSRLFKLMVKDKQAFRDSLRFILDWDFERVLLPHNGNIETGAKAAIDKIVAAF